MHGRDRRRGDGVFKETRLGRWIKRRRAELRLTQTQLSEASRIPQSNISSWEKGRQLCRACSLAKLVAVIGEPPEDVVKELRQAAHTLAWRAGKYGKHYVAPRTGIGERIRKARSMADLSVNAVARKAGISRNTLLSWELGFRNPSLRSALQLADFYGVSLDWLLGREDKVIRRVEADADAKIPAEDRLQGSPEVV